MPTQQWPDPDFSPSTLPVQEPAGAVEAIKRLRQSLETWTGCEGAVCNREDVAVVLDALASLQPVTQAKSEAVAHADPETLARLRPGGIVVATLSGGAASRFTQPLYAAPQEAVERHPLSDERAFEIWLGINAAAIRSPFVPYLGFARAIERAHGIGPATQERAPDA